MRDYKHFHFSVFCFLLRKLLVFEKLWFMCVCYHFCKCVFVFLFFFSLVITHFYVAAAIIMIVINFFFLLNLLVVFSILYFSENNNNTIRCRCFSILRVCLLCLVSCVHLTEERHFVVASFTFFTVVVPQKCGPFCSCMCVLCAD